MEGSAPCRNFTDTRHNEFIYLHYSREGKKSKFPFLLQPWRGCSREEDEVNSRDCNP